MTKLEIDNNQPKKEIGNKLNNEDRLNTIRNLFSKSKKDEHENKDISGKKVQERKGSFTYKPNEDKFLLDQENEKTAEKQDENKGNTAELLDRINVIKKKKKPKRTGFNQYFGTEHEINNNKSSINKADINTDTDHSKTEIEKDPNMKNDAKIQLENISKIEHNNIQIEEEKNNVDNKEKTGENKNSQNIIEIKNKNEQEQQNNQYDKNKKEKIDNVNRIDQNQKNNDDIKLDNHKEKTNNTNSNKQNEHDIEWDGIKYENKENKINESSNKGDSTENKIFDVNKIEINDQNKKNEEVGNQIGNDNSNIGNPNINENPIRNETNENNNVNDIIKNLDEKKIDNDNKINIVNVNNINKKFVTTRTKRLNSFSFKDNKKSLDPENKNSLNDTNLVHNENKVDNNISTTKSNRKKKIIAAFVFGIISIFSGVTFVVALLEVLKLLVIIAAFVLVATTITTIVLIIFIFRDNKLSEPDNVQKNLEQANHSYQDKNDKYAKIERAKSFDLLNRVNLNKKNIMIDENERK